MPLSDRPLPFQVILFLVVFVVIGIYPAIKRALSKLRKVIETTTRPDELFAFLNREPHVELFADHPGNQPLNEYENIVLRRLAQAGDKALSFRQVNEPLLFGEAVLLRTLQSLSRRRMVSVRVGRFLGQRFKLSDAGRRFAKDQGYIVEIVERKGLI